jgi:hypothetical protein
MDCCSGKMDPADEEAAKASKASRETLPCCDPDRWRACHGLLNRRLQELDSSLKRQKQKEEEEIKLLLLGGC